MAEQFVGEIRMFAGDFAPEGWLFCDGAALDVQAYQSLFSLIYFTYGGNYSTKFCVPDLRGCFPAGLGTRSDGTGFPYGSRGGADNVQLTIANLPSHDHPSSASLTGSPGTPSVEVTGAVGTLTSPAGNLLAASPTTGQGQALVYAGPDSPGGGQLAGVKMAPGDQQVSVAIGATGSGVAVPIMPPYQTIGFIISTQGYYPIRSAAKS